MGLFIVGVINGRQFDNIKPENGRLLITPTIFFDKQNQFLNNSIMNYELTKTKL
jgi:hypothetical protein